MENKIHYWRTEMGKKGLENIIDSYKGERISQGPVTRELENRISDLVGAPYVVCTTSGSMALFMTALTLGLGPGDEVIIPNRTFHATAHAVLLTGADVRLCDVMPDIPAMDVEALRKLITPKTKAIYTVQLNGRSCDMENINEIAREHGLFVVEDAAQAFLSRNQRGFLGTQGDMGIYSMGMTKFISTGQGGLVVTKSRELYERLISWQSHGVVDTMEDEYRQLGFNFRFNDILASIGLGQIEMLEEKIERVNTIYKMYDEVLEQFPFLQMIPVRYEEGEIPLWVEVLCSERERLREFLASKGIGTRKFLPNLEYSPYIHKEPERQFPNSRRYHAEGLFLPAGPAQPLENVERTIETLREYDKKR